MCPVQFIDVPPALAQNLMTGDVDICVLSIESPAWSGQPHLPPLVDRLVGVMAASHPLAGVAAPSQVQLDAYPGVNWSPGYRRPADHLPIALAGSPSMLVEQFTVMPFISQASDCIAAIPLTLAAHMAKQMDLKVFELPGPAREIPTSVIWSPVFEAEPAHRWFRELTSAVLHSRAGPPPGA